MKRITLIGISIVAVFVLLMTPSISAVQYNTAVESNKAQILEQMRSMNIDELREKIKNVDIQELKEKIKNIDGNEKKQLLQSFIKSSDSKSGTFDDIIYKILVIFLFFCYLVLNLPIMLLSGGVIPVISGFFTLFYLWVLSIPTMLLKYHIYLPFWVFVTLIFLAFAVA